MLKTIIKTTSFLTVLLLIAPAAHAWTNEDSAWETAYLAAHVADWGQTRDIATACATSGAFKETNPLLGDCPSVEMVNAYFVGTALLHAGVAHMLPRKYRRMFQVGTLGMELNFVNNNKQIGLKINF